MTDFDTFLNAGWNDHAAEPEAVFARCRDAAAFVEEPGQLAALGILAAHVSGEHLGRRDDGAAFLDALRRHGSYRPDEPGGRQLHLSKASLHLASGERDAAERELAAAASAEHHPGSPRVRMPEASRRAERALATMDSERWRGAGADYESLRNTVSGGGAAGGLG